MNVKEIIESGILEEYVLGTLSDREAEEITRLCAENPVLASEVEAIEATLLQAFSAPVDAKWKQEILGTISREPELKVHTEIPAPDPKIIPIAGPEKAGSIPQKWFWAAASFAGLFILSAAGNFYLLTQNQSLHDELTEVRVKLGGEMEEKTVFAASLKKTQEEYNLLFNPDFSRIKMDGTPAFAANHSVLYWNPKSGEVIWDGSSLPALSAGEQYQLWAIVDGKPQNGGVLTARTPAKMLETFSAQAFAVTIEPKGGSESPTLDKMVVFAPVTAATT